MFDIASTELLLVALVALVVIGPKDLPRVLRIIGNWVGKARGVAAQFKSGFDDMVRESELQDLEKKWQEENERILRAHPDLATPPSMTAGTLPDAADAESGNAKAANPRSEIEI
jgi:sec-independent protein translocase protein TatB